MPDRVQLRHQDYLISVGTILPGQTVTMPVTLDNDAGFIARGWALHIQPPLISTGQQTQLQNLFIRFAGPDDDYNADQPVRFANENADFGQFGNFLPIRQPVYYPPGGVIKVQCYNGDTETMTGVEVYFRGSKVYQPGVLSCAGYPQGANVLPWPFLFPTVVKAMGVSAISRNNILQAQSDSDFIIRAINIGSWEVSAPGPAPVYFQLYVQFKDQVGKVYSNAPVHVDACFGSLGSMFGASNQAATHGPYRPPLLLPEIYLPANNILYYDLYRYDSGFQYAQCPSVVLAAVDVQLLFQGMKVFRS